MPSRDQEHLFARSDIDIFLIAKTEEEASEKIKYLVDFISSKSRVTVHDGEKRKTEPHSHIRLIRSANAITVWAPFPFRLVTEWMQLALICLF